MDLDHFIQQVMLTSTQHRFLYHFTDTRNLPSIRQHGILSTRELRARGIAILAPGGNQWSLDADKMFGMDAYVHLCFTNSHPMAFLAQQDGRIQTVTYLYVRPDAIKIAGVMITNDVSNKSGVVPRAASEMLDTLDLEVIYKRTDWRNPAIQQRLQAAEKYELLVPSQLSATYITNMGNG